MHKWRKIYSALVAVLSFTYVFWNTPVKIIGLQLWAGSFSWWYLQFRVGWLGMNFEERISMRWLDVFVTGILAICILAFSRQIKVVGHGLVDRLFRISMGLAFGLAVFLLGVVVVTFIWVPYVPASFPPATPCLWISMGLELAAPLSGSVYTGSIVMSSVYYWRWKREPPLAFANPPHKQSNAAFDF